jgi:hypothetical protein
MYTEEKYYFQSPIIITIIIIIQASTRISTKEKCHRITINPRKIRNFITKRTGILKLFFFLLDENW